MNESEWPKIETVAGERRAYFGPFDLVGLSCNEFAQSHRISQERDALRDALKLAEQDLRHGVGNPRTISQFLRDALALCGVAKADEKGKS